MSLLDALGLSGGGLGIPLNLTQAQLLGLPLAQQQFQNLQRRAFSQPSQVCIHPDCPMCREQIEHYLKSKQEQEELKVKKQEDYKKRCKEYMKKWRKINEY